MDDLLSSKLPSSQSISPSCDDDDGESHCRRNAAPAADGRGVAHPSSLPKTTKKISAPKIVNDTALSPTENVRRRCRKGILKKPSSNDYRRSSSCPTEPSSPSLVRWDKSINEGHGEHFVTQLRSHSFNITRTKATKESRWSSSGPILVHQIAVSDEMITRDAGDEDGDDDSWMTEHSDQTDTTTTFKFNSPSFLTRHVRRSSMDLHQKDDQRPQVQPQHSLLSLSLSSSSPPSSPSRVIVLNRMIMPPMKPVRRSSLDSKQGLSAADNIAAMMRWW